MDGSPQSSQDLYQVLGVARSATPEEIKKAYRAIAKKSHPDRTENDPAAEDIFKEATQAFKILIDPAKRRRYDRGIDPVASVMDLFRERAGKAVMEVMLPSAPAAPKRGVDIRLELPVSSEMFRSGGSVEVSYETSAGPHRFVLEIPWGAYRHPWVTLEGLGHPGRNGALAGSLMIRLVEVTAKPQKRKT